MDITTERPPPIRTFRRSSDDRYLGGVAGGLGDRLGIDPAILRLALMGFGAYCSRTADPRTSLGPVVAYAVVWAMLPTGTERSLLRRLPDRAAAQEIGLIATLVAVAAVAVDRPEAILIAGLGALAVLLLRDRPPAPAPPATPAGPNPTSEDGIEVAAPIVGPLDALRAAVGRPARTTHAPGLRAPRPHGPRRGPALWPLAAGLLALLLAGTLAVDAILGIQVDPRIVLDIALIAVGGVLALSWWRGRARAVLLALPLLLPLWFATSVADIGRYDGIGSRTYRPQAVGADRDVSYELGYGTLDVDLQDLELPPGSTTHVTLGLTAGQADLTVPAEAEVRFLGRGGIATISTTDEWGGPGPRTWAFDQSFDQLDPARVPQCTTSDVRVDELYDLADRQGIDHDGLTLAGLTGDPDEVRALTDGLSDAIAEAGYPRPTLVRRDEGYDDGYGTVLPAADVLTTALSDVGLLCDPDAAPIEPPVVVVDATLGLATLEVHRV